MRLKKTKSRYLYILAFILALTACQKNLTNENSAKVQESIEKIKIKIQENSASEKQAQDTSDKNETP
jgi:type III secretory pathway lipoprotein EscJ